MGDHEDYLEVLRIHQGYTRRSGSSDSDSSETSEKEKVYDFLKPAPIPAEEIRQKAVHWSPSPETVEQNGVLPSVTAGINGYLRMANDSNSSLSSRVERTVYIKLMIARDLLNVQKDLQNFSDKSQFGYLDALNEFRINVEKFQHSIKLPTSKEFEVEYSVNRYNNLPVSTYIETFKHVSSYLCAFILSEYLLILRKCFDTSDVDNSFVKKVVRYILNVGNLKQIKPKIQGIDADKLKILTNILDISPLEPVQSSDDILKELDYFIQQGFNIRSKKSKSKKKLLGEIIKHAEEKCNEELNINKSLTSENEILNKELQESKLKEIVTPSTKEQVDNLQKLEGGLIQIDSVDESGNDKILEVKTENGALEDLNAITKNDDKKKKKRNRSKKKKSDKDDEQSNQNENMTDSETKDVYIQESNDIPVITQHESVSKSPEIEKKKKGKSKKNDKQSNPNENMTDSEIQDDYMKESNEIPVITSSSSSQYESVSKSPEIDEHQRAIKLIEHFNSKLISVFNVLQLSIETFDTKNIFSSFQILQEMHYILANLNLFNNNLPEVFSVDELNEIDKTHLPVFKMCESYLNACFLTECCKFQNSLGERLNETKVKSLSYQVREMIFSLGSLEEIYRKLKHRCDRAYSRLSRQFCVIMPASTCSTSNEKIMKNICDITNSEDYSEMVMEDDNKSLVVPKLPKIEVTKYIELNCLQLNWQLVNQTLSIQQSINFWVRRPVTPAVVFNNVVSYFKTLKCLEDCIGKKFVGNTIIHQHLATLDSVISNHILRIFLSEFYSFILIKFCTLYQTLCIHKETNEFRLELVRIVNVECPFSDIEEKLYHKNSIIYSKYCKLLNIQSDFVVETTSEILDFIFLIAKKSGTGKIANLINDVKTNIEESKKTVHKTLLEHQTNLNKNVCQEKTKALDLKTVEGEIGQIICELMLNEKSADIAKNSILRQIEFANLKTLKTFNILRYCMDTLDDKYSIANFEILKDINETLKNLEEFNDMLEISSSFEKFVEVQKNYKPISENIEASMFVYFVTQCKKIINAFRFRHDVEADLYLNVLRFIQCLGTPDEIFEKLRHRNFIMYLKITNEFCEIKPEIVRFPGNIELVEFISETRDYIVENWTAVKLKMLSHNRQFDIEHINSLKTYAGISNDLKDLNIDLHLIGTLVTLQKSLMFWSKPPANVKRVIQDIEIYFKILGTLEKKQQENFEIGSFISKYFRKLDDMLNEIISKIIISELYCFLLYKITNLLKVWSKLVKTDEMLPLASEMLNIINLFCSSDMSIKLKYRNNKACQKFFELLNIKGVIVTESSRDVLEEFSASMKELTGVISEIENQNKIDKRKPKKEKYKIKTRLNSEESTRGIQNEMTSSASNNKEDNKNIKKEQTKVKSVCEEVLSMKSHFNESEMGKLLIQVIEHQTASNRSGTILNLIEYSNAKVIAVFNLLHSSNTTFGASSAIFETLKEVKSMLHLLENFIYLLTLFSDDKFVQIQQNYLPVAQLCQAHMKSYFASTLLELKSRNSTENEVNTVDILELLFELKSFENFKNTTRYKNDSMYIKLAKEVCTIIPAIQLKSKYKNDSDCRNSKDEEIIAVENAVSAYCEKIKILYGPKKFEIECIRFDLEVILSLAMIQQLLENLYLTSSFNFLFLENMKNYLDCLKCLEDFEIPTSEYDSFAHEFLKSLDGILGRHVLKIVKAHFYVFIFSLLPTIVKSLPMVCSEAEMENFLPRLLHLIRSVLKCVDDARVKMMFRNDGIFLKIASEIIGFEVNVSKKSTATILEELEFIFNLEIFESYYSDEARFGIDISLSRDSCRSENPSKINSYQYLSTKNFSQTSPNFIKKINGQVVAVQPSSKPPGKSFVETTFKWSVIFLGVIFIYRKLTNGNN